MSSENNKRGKLKDRSHSPEVGIWQKLFWGSLLHCQHIRRIEQALDQKSSINREPRKLEEHFCWTRGESDGTTQDSNQKPRIVGAVVKDEM